MVYIILAEKWVFVEEISLKIEAIFPRGPCSIALILASWF